MYCGVPVFKYFHSFFAASIFHSRKIRRTACHRGFFSIQFILLALSHQFTTLVVRRDSAAQVFDTMGIDLAQWRNVIGTFNANRFVYTTTDSNYKETSNQRLANPPNNQRFIVCITLLIFTYFVAIYPLICMDIETNPGPENICNRLNDNQRTLFNNIRCTQLQLIKHQHHLDFLLAQTAQHTVSKGLIPKSVPNANLQANLYNLWYQNILIFAQSQMQLLVKHHEHSIINLHSELNKLWYNLSLLCDYQLLLQIQQNISHSCINLKNKLQSKESRKLKRDLPKSHVNIIHFSSPIPVGNHFVNLSHDSKMYQ